jgi:hypothetical protein
MSPNSDAQSFQSFGRAFRGKTSARKKSFSRFQIDASAAALGPYNIHEIDGVFCAQFIDNAGTVNLDRPRADSKFPPGLLVGVALHDQIQNVALPKGQQFAARKIERTLAVGKLFPRPFRGPPDGFAHERD